MPTLSINDLRAGAKVEIDGGPYVIVSNEFVKPGKGQAFNRVRLKHLISGRTIDRTFKSGDKLEIAEVFETQMRMLYREIDGAVFMDDNTFEQMKVSKEYLGDADRWLLEDLLYEIVTYKGELIAVTPPIFMEMVITQTDPAVRGDTASGRVMKPATTESGAMIQVPIFVDAGEKVKVDTRTGEYVSRVSES